MVFGLIFGFSFSAYFLDQQNSAAALANWLGAARGIDSNLIARSLFVLAACLLVVAALIRTWASSYLNANVVYASEVKTESLVADGPYRRVRNPLYFANVLLALGMGAMMSRIGFFVGDHCDAGVLLPADFSGRDRTCRPARASSTSATNNAVPRLWPALRPRTASAGRQASWMDGIQSGILVLGIRRCGGRVCHHSEHPGIFRRSWRPASSCCGCPRW